MSKVYVVSYDFKTPNQTRMEEFFAELTGFPAWWHFIDGTWLIKSDISAKGIYEKLRPYLTPDVNLLILEAGKDSAGWLPKKAWEWIRENAALSNGMQQPSYAK